MKDVRFLAMMLVLAVLLAGCGSGASPAPTPTPIEPSMSPSPTTTPSDSVTITLERTAGFFRQPSYKVTILSDGTVAYEGRQFVKVEGNQRSTLSAAAIKDLVSAFDQANYFSLRDSYEASDIYDQPLVITSFTLNGRAKVVRHYLGDTSAPAALSALENRIDEVVGVGKWIQ